MNDEIIREKYEGNPHLNTLYDVLSSLQSNGKYWYPEDINNDINTITKKINNYIYHGHDGYDVIEEKWYSKFTFKKNK